MNHLPIRILILATILCCSLQTLAQHSSSDDQRLMRRRDGGKRAQGRGGCPRAYIGFSSGINNPVGFLGPQIDIALSPMVSLGTGVGISTWGTKIFGEVRYYFRPCNRGWAIGTGLTYNTGSIDLTLPNIETRYYGNHDIIIDQDAMSNFMLSAYHFFSLGHRGRNRFHIQGGFSIPLSKKTFVSNYELTDNGMNTVKFLAPGGLILGFGFSFGAGRM